MKLKNGIVAAAVAALALGTAVPAVAAAPDENPCQIMGPYYVDGVYDCACLIAAVATSAVLPSSFKCPT